MRGDVVEDFGCGVNGVVGGDGDGRVVEGAVEELVGEKEGVAAAAGGELGGGDADGVAFVVVGEPDLLLVGWVEVVVDAEEDLVGEGKEGVAGHCCDGKGLEGGVEDGLGHRESGWRRRGGGGVDGFGRGSMERIIIWDL